MAADGALEGLRVLLLEDEFLISMDVEQTCRDHGCADVLVFRAPTEVDGAAIHDGVDVAIIDVMVDGGSSLEFARDLHSRNIPFVFATGLSESEEAFFDFPDVPVVTKPYAAGQLIDALQRAMQNGRAP